jgi:hypothetical protein
MARKSFTEFSYKTEILYESSACCVEQRAVMADSIAVDSFYHRGHRGPQGI